jgi:hypothetical protein
MRTKEGRPSREEESAQHSVKSTFHASTPHTLAHHLTPSDAVALTAFTLAVAFILTGLCGLVWVVT